jgi:integrase
MFRLAVKHGRLKTAPAITISEAKNARVGYFERDDFNAVLAQLPEYLCAPMRFAYLTGWRLASEVLPLRWANVDLGAKIVTLDVNTTKNDDGRTFPFDGFPELSAMLEQQRRLTRAAERAEGRLIPYVFHRGGRPIKSYKNAWGRAVDRAARGGSREALAQIVRPQLLGRIVHDFRRTAVRNLVRAGVDESLAMKLTGHRTRAVFARYNITNEADLRAGVAKYSAHLEGPKKGHKGATGGHSRRRAGGGST